MTGIEIDVRPPLSFRVSLVVGGTGFTVFTGVLLVQRLSSDTGVAVLAAAALVFVAVMVVRVLRCRAWSEDGNLRVRNILRSWRISPGEVRQVRLTDRYNVFWQPGMTVVVQLRDWTDVHLHATLWTGFTADERRSLRQAQDLLTHWRGTSEQ